MKIDPNPQIHVEINIWNLKEINLNRLKEINTEDNMGCDIHAYSEKKKSDGTYEYIDDVLDDRDYDVFAFLAGVRNYDHIIPISTPKGIPSDVSNYVSDEYTGWGCDAHSASFVSIDELINFNYQRMFTSGNTYTNYTKYLGEYFIKNIIKIINTDADRIVFFFDN